MFRIHDRYNRYYGSANTAKKARVLCLEAGPGARISGSESDEATQHVFNYGDFATTATGDLIQIGVILGMGYVEAVPASGIAYRVAVDTLTASTRKSF